MSAAVERVAMIEAQCFRVFGVERIAREFLNRTHPLLNGRTPLELARESDQGVARVCEILGRLEAGTAV
jgi:uncharacterized protein (DUF2384 family)